MRAWAAVLPQISLAMKRLSVGRSCPRRGLSPDRNRDLKLAFRLLGCAGVVAARRRPAGLKCRSAMSTNQEMGRKFGLRAGSVHSDRRIGTDAEIRGPSRTQALHAVAAAAGGHPLGATAE